MERMKGLPVQHASELCLHSVVILINAAEDPNVAQLQTVCLCPVGSYDLAVQGQWPAPAFLNSCQNCNCAVGAAPFAVCPAAEPLLEELSQVDSLPLEFCVGKNPRGERFSFSCCCINGVGNVCKFVNK